MELLKDLPCQEEHLYPEKKIDSLTEFTISKGAKGLITIALIDNETNSSKDLELSNFKSNISKFLTLEQLVNISNRANAQKGDLIVKKNQFIVS